jgi:2'-5' RNA ligase
VTGSSARRERSDPEQRLFVAIDPPPEVVADLAAIVDTLEVSRANAPGRSTRVTAQSRWHVTLAFLGAVPAHRADEAAVAVARAVAGLFHAGGAVRPSGAGGAVRSSGAGGAVRPSGPPPPGPIVVRFAGGGTFGRRRFAILWAGIAGDVAALSALSGSVRSELRRARLPYDAKPFRPHLTLARPGDRIPPEALDADVATLSSYVGPPWTVDAVHLVSSELGPDPKHTRLATVPLTRQ